jgi:Tat protein secretion system quality control protein TatD with DNase activity
VLGPLPKERNEPANALIVVDAIAQLKNVAREEVMETVFRNTQSLFGELG